jgi:hypothetical protein
LLWFKKVIDEGLTFENWRSVLAIDENSSHHQRPRMVTLALITIGKSLYKTPPSHESLKIFNYPTAKSRAGKMKALSLRAAFFDLSDVISRRVSNTRKQAQMRCMEGYLLHTSLALFWPTPPPRWESSLSRLFVRVLIYV